MIFCTRKIKKEKVGGHKQITFRSFKNYSVDEYEKALGKVTYNQGIQRLFSEND